MSLPTPAQTAAQTLRARVFAYPNQAKQMQGFISGGIPAQFNGNVAVSASDLAAALGTEDLNTISSILAAINPVS